MSPRSPKVEAKNAVTTGAGHFVNNKVQYIQNLRQNNILANGRQSSLNTSSVHENTTNSILEFSSAKNNTRGSMIMKTLNGSVKAATPMIIATTFTHN
jgi:hypothetical protein